MNIDLRRAEAKDRQEEACQDPGETMFEPPLKVSILFHPSRALESTPVMWGITCPTHSGWFLHRSASCPIESPRLSKFEGAFQVNLSAKQESSEGKDIHLQLWLVTPMTGSPLPCDIAYSMVGQFSWASSPLSVILQLLPHPGLVLPSHIRVTAVTWIILPHEEGDSYFISYRPETPSFHIYSTFNMVSETSASK